ncbi:MAG TPA: S24 family peptidase [Ktedonobacteraceae bacterium]|nr:S24 family peptidase [Ktedonobacteraceae bacterium]
MGYTINGDIVVVVHIEQGSHGEATLKRFFQENDGIRLHPENSQLEDIFIPKREWIREWEIRGKLFAVHRRLPSG